MAFEVANTGGTVGEHSHVAPIEYTQEQIQLIKDTVAKGATDSEFKLFMYRAKNMALDPLKPGLIYFIKYNSNTPGTIVVGIDGFRSKAIRTGKHVGTKRGPVHDKNGRLVGAWAEVYRSDWNHPAREEVSLAEYNTGKAQWAKMPETMIKKVAECAALRMAFPDDLGGVYAPEEMDQAEPHAPAPQERLQTRVDDVLSESQLNRLYALSAECGWSPAAVKAYMRANFQKERSSHLTWVEYQKLCQAIQRETAEQGKPADAPPADDYERLPFEKVNLPDSQS